jgi:hypothetical protein
MFPATDARYNYLRSARGTPFQGYPSGPPISVTPVFRPPYFGGATQGNPTDALYNRTAEYNRFVTRNPMVPQGKVVSTMSQNPGLKYTLDRLYGMGGREALLNYGRSDQDKNTYPAALGYANYLDSQNPDLMRRLRNIAAQGSGGKLQPVYGPNYDFSNRSAATIEQPEESQYSVGLQRMGSQQSAAARGFYQTPYAYQNL